MELKVILVIFAICAMTNSIPMPFRQEVPSDEVVPFVPYTDDVDGKDYRLPNSTKPLRYDVSLTTNVHQGEPSFSGAVRIRIQALEDTNEITLHYRQITIDTVQVFENPDTTTNLVPSTFSFVEDVEFLKIALTNQLQIDQEYLVVITYQGLLRDDNMGFYRSSYKNTAGETVWLATTQFEQTDARHAFPCYDEPHLRAIFGIEITHDSSYNAISNMPVTSRNPEAGTSFVTTKFQDTLPVQPYLIAFVVSDFTSLDNNLLDTPQRVFAKSQSIDNNEAVLALEAGELILEKFEEHLGVTYNLPKMDQIAIPDFDAGAMENWGLVTYREEYLLYNEELATTRQRENILTIIAHEYAHQWFGNHVAPQWWSFLWLNEGFATLYENYLASLVYPEDRLMDTFVIDTVQTVLDTDASPTIRPMTYYVENPERITGLFDRVAYDKSGSVLRMMQVAIGVDTWTKGLRNYLTTKEYEAATSTDLYTALQQAIDEDYTTNPLNIATIMSSWENQAGYPVITVSRSGSQLTLTQDRFFYTEATSDSLWWVPINYVVKSDPDFSDTKPDLWIPGEKTVTLQSETSSKPWTDNDWVVVNIQESSYYRVNYDSNLWNLLIEQLNEDLSEIHLLNRAQLVDDSLNLARSGRIDYDVPFAILEYLSKEDDYIPWAAANRGMTLLNRWLSGSSAYENYQAFVRKIVEPLYNRLGVEVVENEHKLERYARSIAINLACQAGLSNCLTQSAQKLEQMINTGAKIAPDLQSALYCNGLLQSNSTAFFYLQNKMFKSSDQAERTLIINALGCSQDHSLLMQYLNLAIIPGDFLRLTEKFRILVAPVNNGELGLRVMMEFIQYNFHDIIAIAPTQVNTMLSNIASRIASQTMYDEFNSLLTLLEEFDGITSESATNYRASANANLDWQRKNLEAIENFFNEEESTTAVTQTTVTEPSTTTTTLGAGSVVISAFALIGCALIKHLL